MSLSEITAITPGTLPGQWNVFRRDMTDDRRDVKSSELPADAMAWLNRAADRKSGILGIRCL